MSVSKLAADVTGDFLRMAERAFAERDRLRAQLAEARRALTEIATLAAPDSLREMDDAIGEFDAIDRLARAALAKLDPTEQPARPAGE